MLLANSSSWMLSASVGSAPTRSGDGFVGQERCQGQEAFTFVAGLEQCANALGGDVAGGFSDDGSRRDFGAEVDDGERLSGDVVLVVNCAMAPSEMVPVSDASAARMFVTGISDVTVASLYVASAGRLWSAVMKPLATSAFKYEVS